MRDLFIDIETFSSVDLETSGLYKYAESPDFKILLVSYAFDKGPLVTIDLTCEELTEEFEDALFDEDVIKHAHNATFERVCLRRIGYDVPIEQWRCTAVKSAYCGLPFSLDEVSKKLNIVNKKLDTGKALIKFFSCPCKPTGANGYRKRNLPEHSPAKWEQYKEYNGVDVLAEREIYYTLEKYIIPEFEQNLYVLDQYINDRGILVDMNMANNAIYIDEWFSSKLSKKVTQITKLENPNSPLQLKAWIKKETGETVQSLTAETVPALIKKYKDNENVQFVLDARQKLSKSSVKKYTAMATCAGLDKRVRGLFQFYGANRTGRWAGRLVQLQNLPQNHIDDLDMARDCVINRDGEQIEMLYDDVSSILSQLIRTTFIPKPNHIFRVADYSAIEARVVSWLAGEEWRLEVFRTHGKIYEAAAARMFNVPIEIVTKGSDLRAKAKNAELALGYQGSLGAMKRMGGEKMGLSDGEMMSIVHKWRNANPNIVDMWDDYNDCAIKAVQFNTEVTSKYKNIKFACDGNVFTIELPSKHKLFYRNPSIKTNKFGSSCVSYYGMVQDKKIWGEMDTYGGKLTENIVQAISRDILGYAMMRLSDEGFDTVMHVHDETICECLDDNNDAELKRMCDIMGEDIPWAKGLPLNAEGFNTHYYKKD